MFEKQNGPWLPNNDRSKDSIRMNLSKAVRIGVKLDSVSTPLIEAYLSRAIFLHMIQVNPFIS